MPKYAGGYSVSEWKMSHPGMCSFEIIDALRLTVLTGDIYILTEIQYVQIGLISTMCPALPI